MGPAEVAQGPLFIGLALNIFLLGILTIQVYVYYTTFNDRRSLKFFVCVVYVAELVNTIFIMNYSYNTLIMHFGDFVYLGTDNWVFATEPATTGVIASLVQAFFAWRIHVITNNIWIVLLIAAFAVTGLLGSLGAAAASFILKDFTKFQEAKVVVILWLLGAALCDILIAITLVLHLRKHRTGFGPTDDLVNRIIRVTVQTGSTTAICATVDLLLYLLNPTAMHLVLSAPLSKLYSNSLMSGLNSRGGWSAFSGRIDADDPEARAAAGSSQNDVLSTIVRPPPEVFVHVESHTSVEIRKVGQSSGSEQSVTSIVTAGLEKRSEKSKFAP